MAESKALVALELGFQTRLLRTLQESVWEVSVSKTQNVDPALEAIHRRLLVLSDQGEGGRITTYFPHISIAISLNIF